MTKEVAALVAPSPAKVVVLHPLRKWMWALLVAGVAGASLWMYVGGQNAPAYQTAEVDRGTVEAAVSATGTCNAVVMVQVGSQISGTVQTLFADFNTKVKKGQLVARIDPETLEARVAQLRAALDASKAAVRNAEAGMERAKADVAAARAGHAGQQANLVKAQVTAKQEKDKLERRAKLFAEGIFSVEDRDAAQASYDTQVAGVTAAGTQVDAAQQSIQAALAQQQVAVTQLDSARAQVKQSEAAVRQAEVDLKHTEIRAPVDGTVIARRVDVGQTVAASLQAPTLFEIAQDLTRMQVDTSVDEADIGQVKTGQAATFTVDAHPGLNFHGLVVQVRQAPINLQNVVTYDVVVAVSNPELKLFPGMTANVRILTEKRENVLRLPTAALRVRLTSVPAPKSAAGRGEQTVYLLDEDGQARAARVRLGITDRVYSVVESGDVQEGQRVIVGVPGKAGATTSAAPAMGGGKGPRI